jgi:hypothetical protein
VSGRRRLVLAAGLAGAVALVAFVFRFNTLGGALGGFDNDHFIYLIRTDVLLAGEQPLRDFADAELRGAWPALTYAVSAWAQQIGGRTLLPEAVLSVGALALASAIVFVLGLRLSRRWSVAILAAAVTIVMSPKLYNYPKVLMLALGIWALVAAIASPSALRLGALALVTVAAALFRHDLALYIVAPTVAALVARDAGEWRNTTRTVATYVALTLVLALPSMVWVQVYEGIPSYVAGSLASVAVERARTQLFLPDLDLAAPFSGDSLLLVTYYAFWAVPAAAAVVWAARVAGSPRVRFSASERAAGAGLVVMAVLASMSFLRANLAERFGDAAVPVVLLAAWTAGTAAVWSSPAARAAVALVPALLLVQMFAAAWEFSDVRRELDTSGLSDSWGKITRRYAAVRDELRGLPPAAWQQRAEQSGIVGAAAYVGQCTSPDDRILVTGATHEIPVLARRRFAAGQAMFKLSLYTSERDQQRALTRLEQQSVPLVLVDARESEGGVLSDYPLVARHLAARYREAGTIDVDEEPRLRLFVDARREPARLDPRFGLPCFQ